MIDESVYIAKGAVVVGDVSIGEESSVWFNAVLRSEEYPIVIGKRTNIQDNCTIHVSRWDGVEIGDDVTVGHGAIVHGCKIGNNCLIGMGSIIMNGAVIGDNCIVGAGSLVTEGTVVADGRLVLGSPARVVRAINEEDINRLKDSALSYAEMAKKYKEDPELS